MAAPTNAKVGSLGVGLDPPKDKVGSLGGGLDHPREQVESLGVEGVPELTVT